MKKILITGASGLMGSALSSLLEEKGYEVFKMVRRSPKGGKEILWDIERGLLEPSSIEGFHGVIHLSGENVTGRWTGKKKEKILKSRIESTRLLVETFGKLTSPPAVFLCASGVGYYGFYREEVLEEDSSLGEGFLAEVCKNWEAEAQKAQEKGLRTVLLRLGVVLSPKGGALGKMILPFKFCLGGKVASGEQYMSWISLPDALSAILHCLEKEELQGPVNIVSPKAVTNGEFTKALGRALKRPTLFPLPAFVVKLIFGEMGRETLLASQQVKPKKLLESSFSFAHENLPKALAELLS